MFKFIYIYIYVIIFYKKLIVNLIKLFYNLLIKPNKYLISYLTIIKKIYINRSF